MTETVIINGKTFTDEDYINNRITIREGWVFWEDENHSGSMYLTQEVVDKYKLDKLEDVVEEREDIDQDDEYDYPDFKWKLYFGHQGGVVNPETGEWIYEFNVPTPWGETYSKEFVAWWY